MPRHRALSAQSRALTTVAFTGAALGASVLAPVTAIAAPAGELLSDHTPGAHLHHHHADESGSGSAHSGHRHKHHRTELRPMTSGEEQYRNGCRHGYITQNCNEFSVSNLLGRGINPSL
jgi:hypothetical protein